MAHEELEHLASLRDAYRERLRYLEHQLAQCSYDDANWFDLMFDLMDIRKRIINIDGNIRELNEKRRKETIERSKQFNSWHALLIGVAEYSRSERIEALLNVYPTGLNWFVTLHDEMYELLTHHAEDAYVSERVGNKGYFQVKLRVVAEQLAALPWELMDTGSGLFGRLISTARRDEEATDSLLFLHDEIYRWLEQYTCGMNRDEWYNEDGSIWALAAAMRMGRRDLGPSNNSRQVLQFLGKAPEHLHGQSMIHGDMQLTNNLSGSERAWRADIEEYRFNIETESICRYLLHHAASYHSREHRQTEALNRFYDAVHNIPTDAYSLGAILFDVIFSDVKPHVKSAQLGKSSLNSYWSDESRSRYAVHSYFLSLEQKIQRCLSASQLRDTPVLLKSSNRITRQHLTEWLNVSRDDFLTKKLKEFIWRDDKTRSLSAHTEVENKAIQCFRAEKAATPYALIPLDDCASIDAHKPKDKSRKRFQIRSGNTIRANGRTPGDGIVNYETRKHNAVPFRRRSDELGGGNDDDGKKPPVVIEYFDDDRLTTIDGYVIVDRRRAFITLKKTLDDRDRKRGIGIMVNFAYANSDMGVYYWRIADSENTADVNHISESHDTNDNDGDDEGTAFGQLNWGGANTKSDDDDIEDDGFNNSR